MLETARIEKADGKTKLINARGITQNIIDEVVTVACDHAGELEAFSDQFRAMDLQELAQTIYRFIRENITYKVDPAGQQWIKTPARLWSDKEGDCKSFSIFTSAILQSLKIPHFLRFVSFTPGDFTHVYVFVEGLTIDAVQPVFNRELPYHKKKDYNMTQIARLSGIGYSNAQKIFFAPARAAFMLLLKLNFMHWSEKIAPAFFGHYPQLYEPLGLSKEDHAKAQLNLNKFLHKWHDTFAGDWKPVKKVIIETAEKHSLKAIKNHPWYNYYKYYDNWAGKPDPNYPDPGIGGVVSSHYNSAVQGIGELTLASALAAAAAIIAAVAGLFNALKKPSGSDPAAPYDDKSQWSGGGSGGNGGSGGSGGVIQAGMGTGMVVIAALVVGGMLLKGRKKR